MSNFGTMRDLIADDTGWDATADKTRIETAILSAIVHYEGEKWWFNEERSTASTVASQALYALPSNFLSMDTLRLTYGSYTYLLEPKPWAWIEAHDSDSYEGPPDYFAIQDKQFRLYPVPDAVYTLKLTYTKTLTALSGDSDTNAWMVEGEQLIRERAQADFLASYLRDEAARAERTQWAGTKFLCAGEAQAYRTLRRRADGYTSGHLMLEPYAI